MMHRLSAVLLLLPTHASADLLVAARTIPARTVIVADDLRLEPDASVATQDPGQVVGLEASVTIYSGQPIKRDALRSPARVERNEMVKLIYRSGLVEIVAEGRALARGAAGERIRVMNNASKATVLGEVLADGTILVAGS